MTKADVARTIAKKYDLTHKEAIQVVDAILEIVSRAIAQGKKVELRGFGSFGAKKRRGRNARNPKTGATVKVPPKAVPTFRASKTLKKMLGRAGRANGED